ncbi:MAG: hypothetical protein ACRD2T_09690 [Thermoanaerobaculia bacterium]
MKARRLPRQGPAPVAAYMPGRVVAVLAAESEQVAAGQGPRAGSGRRGDPLFEIG